MNADTLRRILRGVRASVVTLKLAVAIAALVYSVMGFEEAGGPLWLIAILLSLIYLRYAEIEFKVWLEEEL